MVIEDLYNSHSHTLPHWGLTLAHLGAVWSLDWDDQPAVYSIPKSEGKKKNNLNICACRHLRKGYLPLPIQTELGFHLP